MKLLYFERLPPWHYFVIVSDIWSGSIYGIYLLTFYSHSLCCHYTWHLFWLPCFLASVLTFSVAFYLAFFLILYLAIYSNIISGIYSGIYSDILSDMGTAALQPTDLALAVEVRQCTLRSGTRGLCPAVHTAIWRSRVPLRSGARSWGPAVPTGWGPAVHTEIWSSGPRLRSGNAHRNLELAGRRRRKYITLIKSRAPHLAGRE